MKIELHIGELELVGFSPAHRHAIAGAIERTLAELLRERGVPASMPQRSTREAAASFTPHAAPEQVGRSIAHAIFHALGHAPRSSGPGRPTP